MSSCLRSWVGDREGKLAVIIVLASCRRNLFIFLRPLSDGLAKNDRGVQKDESEVGERGRAALALELLASSIPGRVAGWQVVLNRGRETLTPPEPAELDTTYLRYMALLCDLVSTTQYSHSHPFVSSVLRNKIHVNSTSNYLTPRSVCCNTWVWLRWEGLPCNRISPFCSGTLRAWLGHTSGGELASNRRVVDISPPMEPLRLSALYMRAAFAETNLLDNALDAPLMLFAPAMRKNSSHNADPVYPCPDARIPIYSLNSPAS